MKQSATQFSSKLMESAIHTNLPVSFQGNRVSWLVGLGSLLCFGLLSQPVVSATQPNPSLEKQQLAQLNFENAQNYFLQGNQLYQAGNRPGAIAAYQQAIQLEPNYVDAYVGLGNALDDNGQTTEAIAVYRTAIEIDPANPAIYFNLGLAHHRQEEYAAAIAAYKQALAIDPLLNFVYTNLGNALTQLGQFTEAVETYYQAIALNSEDAKAYYSLALTLVQQDHSRGTRDNLDAVRSALTTARDLHRTQGNGEAADYMEQLLQQLPN